MGEQRCEAPGGSFTARLETCRGVSSCASAWRAEGGPQSCRPRPQGPARHPSLAAGTARGRGRTPVRRPESCRRGWGEGLRVPPLCPVPHGAVLPCPPAPQPCRQPFPRRDGGGAGVSTHNMSMAVLPALRGDADGGRGAALAMPLGCGCSRERWQRCPAATCSGAGEPPSPLAWGCLPTSPQTRSRRRSLLATGAPVARCRLGSWPEVRSAGSALGHGAARGRWHTPPSRLRGRL